MTTDTDGSVEAGKNCEQLLAEARSEVTCYSATEALDRHGDSDVTFVDVRDAPELWTERGIPGSVQVSRGTLEFHVDPESPYYLPAFGADTEFVFVCAVGGWSVLAAQRASEMGFDRVTSVEGGFTEWKRLGGQSRTSRPRCDPAVGTRGGARYRIRPPVPACRSDM